MLKIKCRNKVNKIYCKHLFVKKKYTGLSHFMSTYVVEPHTESTYTYLFGVKQYLPTITTTILSCSCFVRARAPGIPCRVCVAGPGNFIYLLVCQPGASVGPQKPRELKLTRSIIKKLTFQFQSDF